MEGLDDGQEIVKYKNERWTRVFLVDSETLGHIQIRVLKEDIEDQSINPMKPKKRKKKQWALAFDPEQLTMQHGELKFAAFSLSDEALKQWASSCSKMREQIRNQALALCKVAAGVTDDKAA